MLMSDRNNTWLLNPKAVFYGHLKQEDLGSEAKSQCFMGSRNRKIKYERFQLVNELKQ